MDQPVREQIPKVIRHPYLRGLQRRHFFLFDVIPLLTVVVVIAFWSYFSPRWIDLGLFVVLYVLTGIGVTVGLHRYFTHRSFQTGKVVGGFLAISAMSAVVGPVISWVGIHRRHHELSDCDGDPHSPHGHGAGLMGALRGLLHAQMGWMADHDVPNPNHYVKDWMRERWLVKLNRRYMIWVFLGLLLPALLAFVYEPTAQSALRGLVWGGIVRIFLLRHVVSSVNSVCHRLGSRAFDTPEHSTNFALLALPTLGEAWHNNHHAFQRSASFQQRWWQVDPGYMVIWMAEKMGLVWDVRRAGNKKAMRRAEGKGLIEENA